jgi:riboflavin biosynthesis pyrimidine reductase
MHDAWLRRIESILSFVLPFTVAFLLHGSTTRHCVANTCYVECTTSLCQTRQGSIIFHPNRMSSVVILSAVSDKTNGNKPEKDNATPIVVNGVTLKMAFDSSTTWGVADLSETKSERFTSPESLDMVHRLRSKSCAVLVGRGTVERDNCTLTVRRGVELGQGKCQPVRVVIDPSLRLINDGQEYAILNDGLPTIIYHVQQSDVSTKARQQNNSITVVELTQPDNENIDGRGNALISPTTIVIDLANRGLHHIMVEGGPATARAFLDACVVDRAILVRAPIKFNIPVPAGMNESTLLEAGLNLIGTGSMGGDTIEYWTRNGLPWPTSQLNLWP